MRSVADDLRDRTRASVAGLSPLARLSLALELGDADAAAFGLARGLSPVESRRVLAHSRTVGRVPSVANGRDVR